MACARLSDCAKRLTQSKVLDWRACVSASLKSEATWKSSLKPDGPAFEQLPGCIAERIRDKLAASLWCANFKGELKVGNGRYCYPLTVGDHASRLLLLCEALESL